jgi:hypothetical protein
MDAGNIFYDGEENWNHCCSSMNDTIVITVAFVANLKKKNNNSQ